MRLLIVLIAAHLLCSPAIPILLDADSPTDGVTLTGDTSKPVFSTYQAGELVQLTFTVKGSTDHLALVTLDLKIVDKNEAAARPEINALS